MIELLSAARIPVAVGLIFAVILLGARASGIGRPQHNREIAQLVATTTIISTAANIGHDLNHYWLAMMAGLVLGFVASVSLRRVIA